MLVSPDLALHLAEGAGESSLLMRPQGERPAASLAGWPRLIRSAAVLSPVKSALSR